jgi:hypothetical protein
MLIVLRARGSRGGGLLMHHLWREADDDASGVFMLTVQQVREYGSSTPDDPAGVQQMQTIITATALPPSAAALMAADHRIKDGKASCGRPRWRSREKRRYAAGAALSGGR